MGRISGPYAAAIGGVVFAAVVLLLAVLSLPEARREDLVFETATAAIQVLPFAFFGVIVAELVRRRDARRAVAQQRSDYLRTFLSDVVLAYNRTKGVRRSLRGSGFAESDGAGMTADRLQELDRHLLTLSDAQLDLERLKREARARPEIFREPAVTGSLVEMEKYVNAVIKEWESGRARLAVGDGVAAFAAWPRFRAFVASQGDGGDFGVAAKAIESIESWIWTALLDAGRESSSTA